MTQESFIAPTNPLERRLLGKYEVLCRLSTGGMSAIYLGYQKGLAGFKKLVVLKTILPDIEGEEDFVGMFLDEARITASFNHPNIAQVFELDTDDAQLFIAMEFVQGCTLVEMARACRQAQRSIPIGLTLAATRDTALALHYAHTFLDPRGRRQIVIHRDVAEKNIMVTYEGVTKLLDFGIAKAVGKRGRTSIGMVKGTSGYMSPEQIRGEPLDPRSDLFALGVVAHECLTGLRLFRGKTAEEGMMAALKEEVQPPSRWNPAVSPELDAVVLKALQRDREKRFSSALEFARALEKAAPGLIWHPEQCGELVSQYFGARRAETRRLFESVEPDGDSTMEVRQSVLARIRASTHSGLKGAPLPVPSAPSVLKVDDNPAVTPAFIRPLAGPAGTHTVDDRPKPKVAPGATASLRAVGATGQRASLEPPSARPGAAPVDPNVVVETPSQSEITSPELGRHPSFDEETGERTIPVTNLPADLKALQAKFAASRRPAPRVSPPVLKPTPSPQSPARKNYEADDEASAKTAIAKPDELPGLPDLKALRQSAMAPPAPAPAAPPPQPVSVPVPPAPIPRGSVSNPRVAPPAPPAPTRPPTAVQPTLPARPKARTSSSKLPAVPPRVPPTQQITVEVLPEAPPNRRKLYWALGLVVMTIAAALLLFFGSRD